jgi:hypothetical protein
LNGIQAIDDNATVPDSIITRAIYSCTGVIVVPTGFEHFVATLTFIKGVDDAVLSKSPFAPICDESELASTDIVHTFVFELEDSTKTIFPETEDNMTKQVASAAGLNAESTLSVKLVGLKVCALHVSACSVILS